MDKRDRILASALTLFVEFGFHGTPTGKIAKEAGVSNGTLFHYFATKEALIKELYISIKNDLNNYLFSHITPEDSIETALKKLFIHFIYWALENREKNHYIQQVLFSPHISQISESVLMEQSQKHIQLIEEAKSTKIIKDLPTDLIYTLANSHLMGIYNYVVNLPPDEQKPIIESGFEMLWDMLTESK
jgi:AcrR family transcriptional regulator